MNYINIHIYTMKTWVRKTWISDGRITITHTRTYKLLDCEIPTAGNWRPEALWGCREETADSNTSAGCLQHFSDTCHSWQTHLLLTKSKQSAFTTYRGDNSSSTFWDTSKHHEEEINQGRLKQMITKMVQYRQTQSLPCPITPQKMPVTF